MSQPYLGIDIALRSFAAALWFDSRRCVQAQFDNTPAGFRRLQRWLQQHFSGQVRAAVEATSTYADKLVHFLHEAGHEVFLLNPERVACYARSLGQRNKTDPADAITIARFIATHEATPWSPPSPEQTSLRSLTRVRLQLRDCALQLRNQLRTAEPLAQTHLRAVLQRLAAQLVAVERQLRALVRAHPLLSEQVRRLCTCQGVGFITACTTLAELPPVNAQSDPRALCAWSGLTPRRWQSGHTEARSRLSRKGNCYLRQALFMPALVAKRHNPLLRTFAERLKAAGKTHGAILGAVSHKLLRILIGLLRHNADFDPNWTPRKIS